MSTPAAAFRSHEAFAARAEGTDDEFAATSATFAATVTVGGRRVHVTCELPTLDAAVVNEAVPELIVEDWLDTFRRRLDGLAGALVTDDVSEPVVARDGDAVVVECTFESPDPAADALAVVNFVEATWFQGVIPGYEYTDRVQAVRERARDQGASGGGTGDAGAE